LALAPNSALVHGLRALYWQRQGQDAERLAEYQSAAGLQPANAEWQADLGAAYAAMGESEPALAALQNATALAPDNARYWSLLALFCANQESHVLDIGLPAARNAVLLAPRDAQALHSLGWSLSQAGRLSEAEPILMEATLADPASAAPHLHLAQTYLRQGDQKSALVELQLAFQVDSGGPVGQLAWELLNQYSP
jgi:Tfp pilus assembly protein PilF